MLNNDNDSVFGAYAGKEVVLAAGGIFTPYLLMVSGIGPKDGPISRTIPLCIKCSRFPNPSTLSSNATFYAAAEAQYNAERQGSWTYGRVSAAAFLTLKQWTPDNFTSIANQVLAQNVTDYLPDRYSQNSALLAGYKEQRDILVKAYLGDNAATGEAVIAAWGHNTIALQKPLSRGTITLTQLTQPIFP
ncbi:GMC oxidoreductase [Stipitochalara longipes BDJ]|nr:GMC oxidoreductase [Stipitochalara longipes BDJ]